MLPNRKRMTLRASFALLLKERIAGKSVVHLAFLKQFDQRCKDFAWLFNKEPIAANLYHPLYNVCSPFQGFSCKPHKDKGDASPTILLSQLWIH